MRTLGHTWFNKPYLGTGIDYSFLYPPSSVFALNEGGGTLVSDPVGRNVGLCTTIGFVNPPPFWNQGKFGPAFQGSDNVHGENNYIVVSSPTNALNDLALPSPAKATWMAWIRPDRNTGVVCQKTDGEATSGWIFGITGGFIYLEIVASAFTTGTSKTVLPLNSWLHIAAVLDGDPRKAASIKLYLNGVDDTDPSGGTDGSGVASSDASQPFYIVNAPTEINFSGQIDHVALWKGTALSAGEVAYLYRNPFAYWLAPDLKRFVAAPKGHGHYAVGGKSYWWQVARAEAMAQYDAANRMRARLRWQEAVSLAARMPAASLWREFTDDSVRALVLGEV